MSRSNRPNIQRGTPLTPMFHLIVAIHSFANSDGFIRRHIYIFKYLRWDFSLGSSIIRSLLLTSTSNFIHIFI